MTVKTFSVGNMDNKCYLVTDDQSGYMALVDASFPHKSFVDEICSLKKNLKYIFLTHGHYDHVGAVMEIMEQTGCEMYINPRDEGYEPGMSGMKFKMPEGGKYYDDGDVVKAAGLEFKVLATPGHTPGGVCLICGNALFTGDTLFRGSCGRTDLPGGNMRMEMASLKRICALPGDYEVYPGHMDSSTLERERRFNHYCREAMTKF